jgi:hypothetical protein
MEDGFFKREILGAKKLVEDATGKLMFLKENLKATKSMWAEHQKEELEKALREPVSNCHLELEKLGIVLEYYDR